MPTIKSIVLAANLLLSTTGGHGGRTLNSFPLKGSIISAGREGVRLLDIEEGHFYYLESQDPGIKGIFLGLQKGDIVQLRVTEVAEILGHQPITFVAEVVSFKFNEISQPRGTHAQERRDLLQLRRTIVKHIMFTEFESLAPYGDRPEVQKAMSLAITLWDMLPEQMPRLLMRMIEDHLEPPIPGTLASLCEIELSPGAPTMVNEFAKSLDEVRGLLY